MANNLVTTDTASPYQLVGFAFFFPLSLFVSKQHRNEAAWDFANSEDAGVWLGQEKGTAIHCASDHQETVATKPAL